MGVTIEIKSLKQWVACFRGESCLTLTVRKNNQEFVSNVNSSVDEKQSDWSIHDPIIVNTPQKSNMEPDKHSHMTQMRRNFKKPLDHLISLSLTSQGLLYPKCHCSKKLRTWLCSLFFLSWQHRKTCSSPHGALTKVGCDCHNVWSLQASHFAEFQETPL